MNTTAHDQPPYTPRKTRLAMWGAIALALVAPLVAMQFTSAVNWTAFDFAAAAVLLVGAGASYEIARLFVRSTRPRWLVAAALALVVVVIWAQGAVGIF